MNRQGITIIELMIAMALLVMAIAGISVVYITSEKMREMGADRFSTEFSEIQKRQQAPSEFISRRIRHAGWYEIIDDGNRINIDIPQDSSKTVFIQSSFYFSEYGNVEGEEMGSIFYDPDTSVDGGEEELYTNIYKISEEPIFSVTEGLPYLIRVYFGYFKGDQFIDEYKRKVEFNVKMRNA